MEGHDEHDSFAGIILKVIKFRPYNLRTTAEAAEALPRPQGAEFCFSCYIGVERSVRPSANVEHRLMQHRLR